MDSIGKIALDAGLKAIRARSETRQREARARFAAEVAAAREEARSAAELLRGALGGKATVEPTGVRS